MIACVSPVIGNICNAKYAVTGTDFQGNKLDTLSQGLSVGGVILPFMGKIKKVATVAGDVDKIANDVNKVDRVVNDANTIARDVNTTDRIIDGLSFTDKDFKTGNWGTQIAERSWTTTDIKEVIANPYTTRSTINRAERSAATAYYTKEGAYVVVDDISGKIVQVSDKNSLDWIPDRDIIDPYKP